MEEKIKKIVAIHIKAYRGKGPEYIKINRNDDLINIYAKGILSTVGELLVKQGAFELPQMAWEELKALFLDSLIDDVNKEIDKKCSLVLERTDFNKNTRTIIIKLDS